MGSIDLLQNLSLVVIIHIILIDLLLSADNAVVIALACRHLDPAKRQQGIVWGTIGAIVVRLALVSVALGLLSVPGLKIVGGLLIAWVAVRLLQKAAPEPTRSVTGMVAGVSCSDSSVPNSLSNASLLTAIKTIVVADFVMSLDNVLAVSGAVHTGMAAASTQGQFAMVVIGLLVSVPMLIFGSSVLLKLLDRFPTLVLAGVGLLGWVAGGMIATDILVLDQFGEISTLAKLVVQAISAVTVMVLGRYWAGVKARA